MSDKIKIGYDKLPAPVVPSNVPLYNLQTGKKLTDEGGIPIVSAEDIVLSSNATSAKATSIVFTDDIITAEEKNVSLSGQNFQALNGAIYSVIVVTAGSGFAANTIDAVYTVPAPVGGVSAKIKYSANTAGGISGITDYAILSGGGNYPVNYTFQIGNAQFKVTQVLTEISGENANFEGQLNVGDRVLLPTGRDSQNNALYEIRKVSVIKDNNSFYVQSPITSNRPRTSSGIGFGQIQKIRFKEINSILPVEEQFATFSEVSTTILGYPKSETQLSLFSNVSSYGLDNDEFLYYDFDRFRGEPANWTQRKSPYYGNHTYASQLVEETEESALILKSFPTPYTYPYGPNVNNYAWDKERHADWNRFIKLGCILYDWYNVGGGGYPGDNGDYARNFLPHVKNHVAVSSGINPPVLYDNGNRLASLAPNLFRPSGNPNGAILSYFISNEPVYNVDQWNQSNNTFTGSPIGTVKLFNFDFTLHFNEEVEFILEEHRTSGNNGNLQLVGGQSLTVVTVTSDMNYFSTDNSAPYNDVSRSEQNFWINLLTPVNNYYRNDSDLYNQIDIWTETWRKIRAGQWALPSGQGTFDIEKDILENPRVIRFIYQDANAQPNDYNGDVFSESLPGHGSDIFTDATIVSRKSFRYQPGRISGFTFGVRASGDATTNDVRLEWGIGNDTDELMFQIQGANINIVRRSVVPLADSVMERNNLDPGDPDLKFARETSTKIVNNVDLTDAEKLTLLQGYFGTEVSGSKQYPIFLDTQNQEEFTGLENKIAFEVKIPRDLWNGDPVNGNGPSKWNLNVEDVTMYKIEFGWYGAIGVRFYAYVPIENNEARWVKLHTLVIENQLGYPSMGDPYYKFKYKLRIDNTDQVSTPQYVYKYGTSCYIDGGDQGTVKVGSAFSGVKAAPAEETGGANKSTTVVGLIPKTVLYNSVGNIIKNKQQIFPRELSLSADGLTEIALVKCIGCPGYGHTYMPNLSSGYRGVERFFIQPELSAGLIDRSLLELPEVTRRATGTAGQTQVQLFNSPNDICGAAATTPIKFLRVNDVFDTENNPSYIVAIDENTNTITLSEPLITTLNNTDIKIQPLFIKSRDEYAKVISDGVYLTYIGPSAGATYSTDSIPAWDMLGKPYQSTFPVSGEIIGIQVGMVTTDGFPANQVQPASYYFEGGDANVNPYRKLEEKKKAGFGFVFAPTSFPGRLSGYNAVAGSTIGLYGRENDLLFLLPNYGSRDQGSYTDGQYSDFKIGITPLKPRKNGDVIEWFKPSDPLNVVEFTEDYKLTAERYETNIVRDVDRYEIGEDTGGFVPPYTVDYRIPQPAGTNTGNCSYIKIVVEDPEVRDLTQYSGAALQSELKNFSQFQTDYLNLTGETFDVSGTYLVRTSASKPFNYNAKGSEIGYNPNLLPEDDPLALDNIPTKGSGIRFATDFIQAVFDDGSASGATYTLARIQNDNGSDDRLNLSGEDPVSIVIYIIKITLKSFRKVAEGSFDYNPFPLYFFIELRDGVTINGAEIRELSQVQNIYNPSFVVSEDMTYSNSNIQVGTFEEVATYRISDPGRVITTGNLNDIPPNFTSEERLSSALVDVQGTSQLRPFEVIDKLYVGNETKQIDLRAIFDFSKESITPDLLNTTAYFFIATCKEPGETSTNVSGTLNYLEQQ